MKEKMFMLFLCIALFCSGCAFSTDESDEDEVTVGENQELVYAVVTAMQGNEMTYMQVEESQIEQQTKSQSDESETKSDSSQDSAKQASDGNTDMGEAPDMGGTPGDGTGMPSDSTETAQMDGAQMGESMTDSTEMGEMPSDGGNGPGNMFSGESVTTLIPVAATVHTAADTTTTFSRIVSGDILKMLVETDADGNQVILEIWMLS